MSTAKADKLVPQIRLSSILKSLVPGDYDIDRVIVMAPQYLQNLSKLLDATSKETLHAYVSWKVIQAYGDYIEATNSHQTLRERAARKGMQPPQVSMVTCPNP